MADIKTFKVIENVDDYLSDKCSPELLVVQALWGVLTEKAADKFCRECLGVDGLEQADEVLQNTDKIYMKEWCR